MRVMLGKKEEPSILVVTNAEKFNPNDFKFWVVNGGWAGRVLNNRLFIGDSTIDSGEVRILSTNQDRLRGEDYNVVFENWNNPDYVAPAYREVTTDTDDNIPF